MRFRLSLLVSFVTLSLMPLSAGSAPQIKAMMKEQATPTVVFVLSESGLPQAWIEPILIIEQGQYKKPITGESSDEEISRFIADYYRKGQKYRMLFGGGEAGTFTVEKSNPEGDCSRTGAQGIAQTKAGLNRNVMALATNSSQLGHKQGSRRAPTAAERASAVSLAQNTYRQKGVPASLLGNMKTINLTATDLNGDGKAELIGTFVVRKTRRGQARYILFLLAEPQGRSYRTGIANYGKLTSRDAQGGLSLDEIVDGGIRTEKLIDQLDLDGDGAAEVMTTERSYESVSYTFYKKQQGQWKNFYTSGGYTCAF